MKGCEAIPNHGAFGLPNVIYDYRIPDHNRPSPDSKRRLGASGELMEFRPKPLCREDIVGRTIDEISEHVGTYGMGGPGFFGLRFSSEWLVIALWGASEWMTAEGRCVGDPFHDDHGRPRPWLADWDTDQPDELSAHLVGQKVKSIDVQRHSLKIILANQFDLTIEEGADRRPVFQGNKQPRKFTDTDDLQKAVFLSPTTEIWV